MAWNAWGSPELARTLSPAVLALLSGALGITPGDRPSAAERDLEVRPSALTEADVRALAVLVGDTHVTTDDASRLPYLGGKSTPDLLRRRSGGPQNAPDAVVTPGSHDEVLALLVHCTAERIAVVPFGGGTSVVGGVEPDRGAYRAVVTVDLRRLDAVIAVDPYSRTATLQAGVTGPRAEELLGAHGLSLGHYPQSFRFATIGGFAATRSSGQASSGYGRFDDMVQELTVATPSGSVHLGRAPSSAAGPDLRQVFLGSEGTLGIITDVTVRVHEIPETTLYRAWSFPSFDVGAEACRSVAGSAVRPTVMRLSDEAETGVNRALNPRGVPPAPLLSGDSGDPGPTGGSLAVATFEGPADHARLAADLTDDAMTAAGATPLDDDAARSWEHGRFDAPYLRDALLSAGALAETLETATSWTDLAAVRASVTDALVQELSSQGTPPLVLCHLSHVYATGASLYFTVVCAQADDAIAQWSAAKRAAGDAIIRTGATITHHHGVGVDHRRWMVDEVGSVGATLLAALKTAVDPAGILNPGKLIP